MKGILLIGSLIAMASLVGWMIWTPNRSERELWTELRSVKIGGHLLRSGGEGPPGLHMLVTGMPSGAGAALRLAGTNSLPLLHRMFRTKPPPGSQALWELAGRIPYVRKWRSADSPNDTALQDQFRAVWAVQQLGARATPILPSLVPLIADPDSSVPALLATSFLSESNPEAILQLTNRFKVSRTPFYSTDPIAIPIGHAGALYELARHGSKSTSAAPYLIAFLGSTNSLIRTAAATACGTTRTAPDTVIPRMIADLVEIGKDEQARPGFDTRGISSVAQAYVGALGEYGVQASNAIPVVTFLLNNGYLDTRRARAALRQMGATTESPR